MKQRYMTHPIHGRMPVYTDAEVELNKKSGWVEDGVEDEKVEVIETIQDQYEKKFGKRPHWKMKPEKIRAALEE